jgi:sarcosine oxidase subunit delta
VRRPDPNVPGVARAYHDYVYLRDNPSGLHQEFWYHGGGCRSWLVVTRNTRTHEISDVKFADGGRL